MQLPLLPELVLPPETTIKPSAARRVHCNRSLRLDGIEWVGFDMDYTLAIYDQEQMDRLSIEATARKLVERGYPERLLRMRYRTDFPIRGLLIDRKLGNVLKMDRYKYVKMAYHGMRELSLEERRRIYHARRLRPATKRYHWVDTLYALSEVAVFAAAIEALEAEDARVDYGRLFSDVRECIDLSHQDGSILDRVLADLPRLVPPDPELGPTLHRLRSSGKKLFLLTNSHAPYTERMMTHLLGGSLADYPSWRNYFELIITAACKPTFFTKREPFEEILDGERRPAGPLSRGKIYAGGNIVDLERSLGAVGDRILYVGDHIYGDVLRAKKETAWRTVMIIQEMDAEFRALEACEASIHRMDQLDGARDALHDRLREQLSIAKRLQQARDEHIEAEEELPTELEAARIRTRRSVDRIKSQLRAADAEHSQLEAEVGRAFHPFWGSIFKAGPEVSLFGDQVEQYACLYTSRVSNFLRYSSMHYFRSARDRMPHEQ